KVSQLFLCRRPALRFGPCAEGALELGDLLFDLLEDGRGVGPVEADACRFLSQAVGAEERRKRVGDALEERGLRGLLPELAALPGLAHGLGVGERLAAEDVGMAGHHLAVDAVDGLRYAESPRFFGEATDEGDLKDQVPQLLLEIPPIAAVDGAGGLVRLLQQIGPEVREPLLAVPGAAVGRTQAGGPAH